MWTWNGERFIQEITDLMIYATQFGVHLHGDVGVVLVLSLIGEEFPEQNMDRRDAKFDVANTLESMG